MTQDQYNNTRNYPDAGVVRGEVVSGHEEERDENGTPQTYLHKVATAARPAGDAPADANADADADADADAEANADVDADVETETTPARDEHDPYDDVHGDTHASDELHQDASDEHGLGEDDELGADEPDETEPAATGPAAATAPDMARGGARPDELRGRHHTDEESLLTDAPAIRKQWMRVQAQFVDDPRAAVGDAANLITDVGSRLEAAVLQRQQALRGRWDGNGQADTELLRVTMQQYRALLDRLTSL